METDHSKGPVEQPASKLPSYSMLVRLVKPKASHDVVVDVDVQEATGVDIICMLRALNAVSASLFNKIIEAQTIKHNKGGLDASRN